MKAVLALVSLAILLAGCNGAGGPTTPEQDGEGRYVIHMTASNKFQPAEATVPANATVVWVVDGGVHDVGAHDGSWSSDDSSDGGLGKKMQAGDRYSRTFAEAGTIEYHCELHASTGMKGKLVVG